MPITPVQLFGRPFAELGSRGSAPWLRPGSTRGLRWGEAVGLTRARIDALRLRIIVESTAIEVHGKVTLGQEPKTRRSKRTIPVARLVMRRLEQHLADHVGREPDALVSSARRGGPLFRSTFAREA